jgi:hypothetical protein
MQSVFAYIFIALAHGPPVWLLVSGLRVLSGFFRFGKPLLVKSGRFWFLHHAVKFHSALFCSTWIRKNRRSRDGTVGVATRYGLDGLGIKSQCGRVFLHPSRPALGPIQSPIQWVPSLSWVKAAGAWRWPHTPSSGEVNKIVELYLYSPFGPSWPVLGWPWPLLLRKNRFIRNCRTIEKCLQSSVVWTTTAFKIWQLDPWRWDRMAAPKLRKSTTTNAA